MSDGERPDDDKAAAVAIPGKLVWCGRRDSNPHDVAIEGF
jgi:hypothetical protein